MDFQYIAWGARGREFESRRSDQTIKRLAVSTLQAFLHAFTFNSLKSQLLHLPP